MVREEESGFFRVAASAARETPEVAAELLHAFGRLDPRLVLFFAGGGRDLGALSRAIGEGSAAAAVAGCSTCGEIGPQGCTLGGVSGLALGEPARAAARLVPELAAFRFEDGAALVESLAGDLGLSMEELLSNSEGYLFVTLTDGLSGREEILIASLQTFARGVRLVGGSAADDYRFEVTWAAVGDQAAPGSAGVVLLEPGVPFHTFQIHHYRIGARSMVVTEAAPERRLVKQIDGRPATLVLSRLLGVAQDALLAAPLEVLAKQQVVFGFKAGGDVYLRSVMSLSGSALLMGGAVEEGTVLHEMRSGDLVGATKEGLARALERVLDPVGLLLFNCGGRMWEARRAERTEELARALRPIPAAGFTTYGEQFGPMQVNHTLTGLVLGASRG